MRDLKYVFNYKGGEEVLLWSESSKINPKNEDFNKLNLHKSKDHYLNL